MRKPTPKKRRLYAFFILTGVIALLFLSLTIGRWYMQVQTSFGGVFPGSLSSTVVTKEYQYPKDSTLTLSQVILFIELISELNQLYIRQEASKISNLRFRSNVRNTIVTHLNTHLISLQEYQFIRRRLFANLATMDEPTVTKAPPEIYRNKVFQAWLLKHFGNQDISLSGDPPKFINAAKDTLYHLANVIMSEVDAEALFTQMQ